VSALLGDATAEMVAFGDVVAVGLGRALAGEQAVTNATASTAKVVTLPPGITIILCMRIALDVCCPP
jgi:hypothetical protein